MVEREPVGRIRLKLDGVGPSRGGCLNQRHRPIEIAAMIGRHLRHDIRRLARTYLPPGNRKLSGHGGRCEQGI